MSLAGRNIKRKGHHSYLAAKGSSEKDLFEGVALIAQGAEAGELYRFLFGDLQAQLRLGSAAMPLIGACICSDKIEDHVRSDLGLTDTRLCQGKR